MPLDPSKQCFRCSGSQVFTFSRVSKKVSKMVRKRSPKGGQVHQKASPDGAPENDQKSHQKIVENVSPRHPQKGAEIHKKGDGKLQKKRWFSQWRPKGGPGTILDRFLMIWEHVLNKFRCTFWRLSEYISHSFGQLFDTFFGTIQIRRMRADKSG